MIISKSPDEPVFPGRFGAGGAINVIYQRLPVNTGRCPEFERGISRLSSSVVLLLRGREGTTAMHDLSGKWDNPDRQKFAIIQLPRRPPNTPWRLSFSIFPPGSENTGRKTLPVVAVVCRGRLSSPISPAVVNNLMPTNLRHQNARFGK